MSSLTTGPSCDSAIFPSNGKLYSRVCGRVIGYQKGSIGGLNPSITAGSGPGLEGTYLDGVSLTHGAPGSRQHIWTFVAAAYENGTGSASKCPCHIAPFHPWSHEIPSFIGNDYFCDTGNHAYVNPNRVVYADDPLWDGKGCLPGSTCCQFNSPPWFCATLPQPTSDDLELRICLDGGSSIYEDVIVSLVEINVK